MPPVPNSAANCATGSISAWVYARLPKLPSGVKCASKVSTATLTTGSASTVQAASQAFTMRRAAPRMSTHISVCSSSTIITANNGMTLRK